MNLWTGHRGLTYLLIVAYVGSDGLPLSSTMTSWSPTANNIKTVWQLTPSYIPERAGGLEWPLQLCAVDELSFWIQNVYYSRLIGLHCVGRLRECICSPHRFLEIYLEECLWPRESSWGNFSSIAVFIPEVLLSPGGCLKAVQTRLFSPGLTQGQFSTKAPYWLDFDFLSSTI